ncbi:hypothetical protein AJ78_00264 [Emergomyces pasteurianus Ep9510]|uniref:DUF7918 domain-containing protein n=1 Tax=Emergomyces pasteurianus Ep9510 TaxID=1447872 RepID=A0A1J9QWS9_9EURO|nr:hypothetical protein AJ78_00264 [Emergomyces pasteurianus Ep9510]
MPTLKQLSCQIEWAGSNVPFKEYGITYGDGCVESYIAIPNSSTPFSVILRSNGYIAPGLAMFVFMDGVYQCNRNRDDLQPMARPSDAPRKYRDISFRVRQREERLPDGSWIGRPWRFERFPLVKSTRENPDIVKYFERLGTIQIIVLRCAAHPRAKYSEDDDIPDGAHTPESGMAPNIEGEDDDSISSDQSSIYECHSGRSQEENGDTWGLLGDLFDGPFHTGCYFQGPAYQQPYPHCCPSCHHPHGDPHPSPFNHTLGRNGRECWHTCHAQQHLVREPHCHVDDTYPETIIDAPDIPQCGTAHSRVPNLYCQAGCHNLHQNLPVNIHGNNSLSGFPQSGHTHKRTSSNRKNSTNNIFHTEPPGDGRLFVPPIVLNISPQQFRDGSRNERTENCTSSNDNGYYVISDGKRVPESSSCCLKEQISGGVCSGADNNRKKKPRKNRRRSRGKDKQEQPQENLNQPSESSKSGGRDNNEDSNDWGASDQRDSWENNGDQQRDQCGVDGEATPSDWPKSNQGVNANNDNSLQGDRDASDDNRRGSSWEPGSNSEPNVRPLEASPSLPQVRPQHQIRNFSPSDPVFVSPMFSEPARDEPPLYTVPESVACGDCLSHQVQFGPQAKYTHRIRTPEYLDIMDKPYAEFVFKYRTADVIQNKFHVTVAPNIDEERRKLEILPRVEIVNQLLHAQGLLSNSDLDNKRSPKTSPPAQSRNQRMAHWDNSNMTNSPRNFGNGYPPGYIAGNPSSHQPQREKLQENGSKSSSAITQSAGGFNASLNSTSGQESQNRNGTNGGGSGEPSWMNQSNEGNSHSTNDDNSNKSRPSLDILTTNDTSGGGNGGPGNGAGRWDSGCESGKDDGISW